MVFILFFIHDGLVRLQYGDRSYRREKYDVKHGQINKKRGDDRS